MSISSVVTPSTNGSAPPRVSAKVGRKATAKASVAPAAIEVAAPAPAPAPEATPAVVPMTKEEAITIASNYGTSLAGIDGSLTKALSTFSTNENVQAAMLKAMNVSYLKTKLGYDDTKANATIGKLGYNEKKQDDVHRTFVEERVMVAVRVAWSRACKLAGIVKAKTEAQVKAEQERAAKEASKEATEKRLIKADELINPKDNVDPFDALSRLVLTMKSLQNKYADKLTGDRGSAWRDWLANAPK